MARERFRGRHSVFWRVAAVLVTVQLATGMLAIGFSAYLASDRSADLAENSLRVRMDALAEEIERSGTPLLTGLENLPDPLLSNLSYRFPDPLVLADTTGRIVHMLYPVADAFSMTVADSATIPVIPPTFRGAIDSGEIVIDRSSELLAGGWAAAPLYDATGILLGGYVIQPLERTIARELAPTRDAFRTALLSVVLVSVLIAVMLAGVFTWWLVKPLRRIAARVIEIGAGEYDVRVEVRGTDEIARLGETVNRMACQVSESIEALKTTDRMRRELVANVGHDLRTPLAALRGYIEEGLRFHEEGRTDAARGAIGSASRQADYLHHLVDDLFELSLLENPSPQLRSEPVPISELLNEAARSHAGRMAAGGIEFLVDIPASLPIIQADGVRLMRLFDNLLSNALRHTPEGGRILLTASVEKPLVQIEVEDSGEGMDSASLSRIFDRYYRGEASRTRDEHGTGLGLAISRAVAELHGGTLEVTSELGRGTTMTLRLPWQEREEGE